MDDYPQEAGVFFTLRELMAIFPRLKRGEQSMNLPERQALLKLEKVLYEYLSVEEAEALLCGPPLPPVAGAKPAGLSQKSPGSSSAARSGGKGQ
jgi:hypothetical protein